MQRNYSPLMPAYLWGGLIGVLSLIPGHSLPHYSWMDLLSFDKICHYGFYGVLSYFILRGLVLCNANHRIQFTSFAIFSIVVGTTWGLIMEFFQMLTPDRNFDWMDGLADLLGCVFGVLVYWKMK